MKKKNLIILLMIPFLIALLGVVAINTTFSLIDNDIVGIKWSYTDNQTFELNDTKYLLSAEGINEKNYPAGKGNNLVWSVANKNSRDENPCAEIVRQGDRYYLKPLESGEVVITCSNEKGNVFKKFTAIIYSRETSVISINTVISSSQQNIDETIYYGEYDLKDNKKVKASFDININVIPANEGSKLFISSTSSNIAVDLENKKVYINGSGPSYFTISGSGGERRIIDKTYYFETVKDGINVYTYNDLLACTNKSETGEIVVLRKSFESLDNLESNNANNVVCFGNYNEKTKKFNFKNEIYKFTTTYNKSFIEQWNNYIKQEGGTNFISDQIMVGLHVQKDFYGNGYTVNMHNLTYPSEFIPMQNEKGESYDLPELGADDIFRGPLPFYALGDHKNTPLIEAFGQDNIGMYVDGNNITINDVNLKNCDFGNMIRNLDTVGTVLETHGKNITIKNSVLSNGKNIVRSFSSMNTTVQNSLLQNSRNFLMSIGTNEYILPDKDNAEYLKAGAEGDIVVQNYYFANFTDKKQMKRDLLNIQDMLNKTSIFSNLSDEELYKGTMNVIDTFFYRSGIASISLDTMFNGPFLFNSVPSSVSEMIAMLSTQDGVTLKNLSFSNIGGMAYPVKLKLSGNTEFYDYKTIDEMDINGLIKENISKFVGAIKGDYAGLVTIDKIFPVKTYLMNQAQHGYTYRKNGKTYINVPIAYYGGGANLSKVDTTDLNNKEMIGDSLTIDFLDEYLELKQVNKQFSGFMDMISYCLSAKDMTPCKNVMLKSVTVVTGYEPFKFKCMTKDGYLYGESPNIQELIKNAKGE